MNTNFSRRTFLAGLGISVLSTISPRILHAQSREKVLIIGAGMSGIAAAKTLVDNGFSVTILEARNEIGGRIRTDTSLGIPLDLGASFIHGSNGNPLVTLAQQFGLTTYNTENDDYLYIDRNSKFYRSSTTRQGTRAFEQLAKQLRKVQDQIDEDRSIDSVTKPFLKAYRASRGTSAGDLLDFLTISNITIETGGDLKELSLLYFDDDEGFTGPDLLLPGGYRPMIAALSQGLDIKFGTSVTGIEYSSTGVTVSTTSEKFSADRVIVTVPLGALKKQSIQFSPELPASKLGAISRLSMGLLDKVFLKFPTAFWQKKGFNVGYFGFASAGTFRDIPEFYTLDRVTGTPVLLGFIAANQARKFKSVPDTEVLGRIMQRFRKVFGKNIPDPEGMIRTSWSDDQYTHGSYSIVPVNGAGEDLETLSESVGSRIFFAGEATNRGYPGTVHGAYLSGVREANKIIQLV